MTALDSQTFISGSADETIKLWKIDNDTALRTYDHTDAVCASAMLDSQTFISGSWDETIKLWKIDKNTALHTYEGHASAATALAMLNSETFISGSRTVFSDINCSDLGRSTRVNDTFLSNPKVNDILMTLI